MPLDAEFSLIGTRRTDVGLGWLTTSPEVLPAALEAMVMGESEPEVWIPSGHPAARPERERSAQNTSLAIPSGGTGLICRAESA